jgi:ectoine hydroxylase-related dioxygenase (phytanoyl-CoA dioxygenase family)
VKDNRSPSHGFVKPTKKAGVPHIQAPQEVLECMLALRLHLDEVTEENGPLRLIPGSHCNVGTLACAERPSETILAGAGDVLVVRPLLLHCSGRSQPETRRHRRILHLEFSGMPELADGFAWHEFIPGNGPSGTIVESTIK